MQEPQINPEIQGSNPPIPKKSWIWKSWEVGTLMGIPFKLHWSLPIPILILVPIQTLQVGWPQGGIALLTIPLAMLIVTIHELGHCTAASMFKMNTKSITLTGLGGIAAIKEKPNADPKENLIVAVAGPMVNIIIAIIMMATLGIPSITAIEALGENPFSSWANFYPLAFIINITLLSFNLLPVYPMDGGRILKEISEIFLGRKVAGFLILTACLSVGVPTALLMASNKLIVGAGIISTMSLLGILEGLTILEQKKEESEKTTTLTSTTNTQPQNERTQQHEHRHTTH